MPIRDHNNQNYSYGYLENKLLRMVIGQFEGLRPMAGPVLLGRYHFLINF